MTQSDRCAERQGEKLPRSSRLRLAADFQKRIVIIGGPLFWMASCQFKWIIRRSSFSFKAKRSESHSPPHVPVAEPSTASEAYFKDRARPAKPLSVLAPYLRPQVQLGLERVRTDDDAVVGKIDHLIDGRVMTGPMRPVTAVRIASLGKRYPVGAR